MGGGMEIGGDTSGRGNQDSLGSFPKNEAAALGSGLVRIGFAEAGISLWAETGRHRSYFALGSGPAGCE